MVLHHVALDMEDVVALKDFCFYIVFRQSGRRPEVSGEGPFRVRAHQGDGRAGLYVGLAEMGPDAVLLEIVRIEISVDVAFAGPSDEAAFPAHRGDGGNRVGCRAAGDDGIGLVLEMVEDFPGFFLPDQGHAAFGQAELLQYLIRFQMEDKVHQGVAHTEHFALRAVR